MKTENLKQSLEAFNQLKANAGQAIIAIADSAARLGQKSESAELRKAKDELDSDRFKIILIGRFRNGKSTLMNALLGRTTHAVHELSPGKGPMPTGDLPTTATLTSVTYAEKPFVRVYKFDGKHENWSLERYLREAIVRESEEETVKFFENIQAFELGYPAERCRDGIMLLDSPGTADVPLRTAVTVEAVKRCDAAIVVYHQRAVAGQDEKDFVEQQVTGTGINRIFTVVNMDRPWDDEVRARRHTWNRLSSSEGANGKAPENNQDFARHDIYFINAKKAHDGRFNDNAALVEESGILSLENALAEFLSADRPLAHLDRFIRRATTSEKTLQQYIRQQRYGLNLEAADLEKKTQAIQEQIKVIGDRRKIIVAAMERARRRYKDVLRTTYESAIVRTRTAIATELKDKPFASGIVDRVRNTIFHKKLLEEAGGWCNEIITRELGSWKTDVLPGALKPIAAALNEEIVAELAGIDQAFTDIRCNLSPEGTIDAKDINVVSYQERGISVMLDLLWNPLNALTGGGGGLKTTAITAAGQFGALVALIGFMGVAAPVAIPIVAVFGPLLGFIIGRPNAENRAREKVLTKADEWLVDLLENTRAAQSQAVDETFNELDVRLLADVDKAINADRDALQQIISNHKCDRSAKIQLIAQFDEESARIETDRKTLESILVAAKQTR